MYVYLKVAIIAYNVHVPNYMYNVHVHLCICRYIFFGNFGLKDNFHELICAHMW